MFTLEENKKKGKWSSTQITLCGDDYCLNGLTNVYGKKILSFGEDDDGRCLPYGYQIIGVNIDNLCDLKEGGAHELSSKIDS